MFAGVCRATNSAPPCRYASLHMIHAPIEAPPAFVAKYNETAWCQQRKVIVGMASVADNVTGQIVGALKTQGMWETTVGSQSNTQTQF